MAAPIGSTTVVSLKLVGTPPAGNIQRSTLLAFESAEMMPPAK